MFYAIYISKKRQPVTVFYQNHESEKEAEIHMLDVIEYDMPGAEIIEIVSLSVIDEECLFKGYQPHKYTLIQKCLIADGYLD